MSGNDTATGGSSRNGLARWITKRQISHEGIRSEAKNRESCLGPIVRKILLTLSGF